MSCKHEQLISFVDITRFVDVEERFAQVKVKCQACELPFVFLTESGAADEVQLQLVPKGARSDG